LNIKEEVELFCQIHTTTTALLLDIVCEIFTLAQEKTPEVSLDQTAKLKCCSMKFKYLIEKTYSLLNETKE
jgi:hypothetical protein